jgi:hypothetical protein
MGVTKNCITIFQKKSIPFFHQIFKYFFFLNWIKFNNIGIEIGIYALNLKIKLMTENSQFPKAQFLDFHLKVFRLVVFDSSHNI